MFPLDKTNDDTTSPLVESHPTTDKSGAQCYRRLKVLTGLMATVAIVVLIVGFTGLMSFWLSIPLFAAMATTAYLIHQLRYDIQTKLVTPLNKVIDWSEQMRKGNLSTRIAQEPEQGYPALIRNINNLSDKVVRLSTKMQLEVQKQTEQSAQKTRALEVLYDAAASINISKNLEDLLLRFLPTLKEVLQAEAVTVRLANVDGQMRLIGSLGLDNTPENDEIETLLPVLQLLPLHRWLTI